MRVLRGDLQRGDGFQAGLDALLLSAVPDAGVEAFLLSGRLALASDVVSSGLQPVDRSLPAAAALALAALGAWRRGGGDISAGGRRGVQHLEPSDRNDGEQTVGLLLGVKREVAEDVLVMRTGSTRQTGSQAASLILKRHIGSVSGSFNTARISSHVKIYYSCSNVRKTTLFSKKKTYGSIWRTDISTPRLHNPFNIFVYRSNERITIWYDSRYVSHDNNRIRTLQYSVAMCPNI